MSDEDREKRKDVTAKRNKLAKKQKDAAKKLKLNQAQWIVDFSDVEEPEESEEDDDDDDYDYEENDDPTDGEDDFANH